MDVTKLSDPSPIQPHLGIAPRDRAEVLKLRDRSQGAVVSSFSGTRYAQEKVGQFFRFLLLASLLLNNAALVRSNRPKQQIYKRSCIFRYQGRGPI